MPHTIWLALSAFSAIFVAAVAYFTLRVSDRDLRVIERTSAAQGVWAAPTGGPEDVAPNRGLSNAVQGAIGNLGRAIMASGILPGKTRIELEQTLLGSGFRGANALATFIGSKLVLLGLAPLGGWFLADWLNLQGMMRVAVILAWIILDGWRA